MNVLLAQSRRYFVGAFTNHSYKCVYMSRVMGVVGRGLAAANQNVSGRSKMNSFAASALSSSFSSTSTPEQSASLHIDDPSNCSEYEQLVRKLYMTNLFNPVKLGLENMNRLHEALGRPMDQVRPMNWFPFSLHVHYIFSRKTYSHSENDSPMFQ